MTATWAVLPVKGLAQAKQRLAPVLPQAVRRRLVRLMLEDVVATLAAVLARQTILVVTPDGEVEELAGELAIEVLREPSAQGLDAAVHAGRARAIAGGARQVLVVPADVPLASPGELAEVLAARQGGRAGAVLVADTGGSGTNALLTAPPGAIAPAFGPGSFARHLARAAAGKMAVRVLELPGLARDIDTPADLARLAEAGVPARYAFLRAYLRCGMPLQARHGGAQR